MKISKGKDFIKIIQINSINDEERKKVVEEIMKWLDEGNK